MCLLMMRRGARSKWPHKLPAPRAARGFGQASSYSIQQIMNFKTKQEKFLFVNL